MDRIELAQQQFRGIAARTADRPWALPARELGVWLADDVGGVVAEYAGRPRFQAYAAWPLRALRPDSGTEARCRVDAFATAAVRHARLFRRFLRTPGASRP